MHKMPKLDYNKTPFLIIWEATQACDLACRHCRASAQPDTHPGELTTEQGEDLIRQTQEMGTPIFIISGGDPLKRTDLYHLIRFGADLGLRMATIPAATSRLTEPVVKQLKEAGVSQMALSLDFPTAKQHDAFRMVPGAYDKTMQAVEWAHKYDVPLQINTTLCGQSAPYLQEMADLVKTLDIVFWEVFFLVPMGRGVDLGGLNASQCEKLFEILYQTQKSEKFLVKVTEAPHFRRHVAQQEWMASHQGESRYDLPSQLIRTEGPGHTIGLASGVNAGNGFLFVSHLGEVFPSGFLPVKGGSLHDQKLADIYRNSEVFKQLRKPDTFKGICGYCEYNSFCGGSRSRAFALTGDYLESDPWCAYRPQNPAASASRS